MLKVVRFKVKGETGVEEACREVAVVTMLVKIG
jgi:hypothetical protein